MVSQLPVGLLLLGHFGYPLTVKDSELMVFKPGGLIHDLVFNNTNESRASKPYGV
jgi:hypothetical protein